MKLLPVLILLFFSSTSFSQNADKEEAKNLAKELVKSYFNKDCDAYLNLWYDTIRIIHPHKDTLFSFNTLFGDTTKACDKFSRKTRFEDGYTYEEYLNDYEIRIYSKKEFTRKSVMEKHNEDSGIAEILEHFKDNYTDKDFLFSGSHLKTENDEENDKLQHKRSWIAIISKTDKGWKITGALP